MLKPKNYFSVACIFCKPADKHRGLIKFTLVFKLILKPEKKKVKFKRERIKALDIDQVSTVIVIFWRNTASGQTCQLP